MDKLAGRTFDEIEIGEVAELVRTLTATDILAFAGVSGDVNPAHLDHHYAAGSVFGDVIGHGMWTGALISTLLGTKLPGPGTIYVGQSFRFRLPVRIGDTLCVRIQVKEKHSEKRRVLFDCQVTDANDQTVLDGTAEVIAPDQRVVVDAPPVPALLLPERGDRLKTLINDACSGPPLRMAVVHPVDEASLGGAIAAQEAGMIEALLVGPERRIREAAEKAGISLAGTDLHDTPHSHAASDTAAMLARDKTVDALMKGALHTDELLGAVLAPSHQLRTERRLTHAYVMDAPAYHKLLVISDAAVNIAPSLTQKADITRNAIDVARALGADPVKVAILSAVETVNPDIQSTIDAAALCKMAARGQIAGALIDGPLAFDNAVSPAAVAIKGLVSDVAGDADVLIVPDLEAGNMLAKQLDYLGGAVAAGVVLGARVPIVLTSRAEGILPRLASTAVAKRLHQNASPPELQRGEV
ncbi:MAG: bifunctional enoyl-CoA hydratase/phosphate acetyltransferase [Pseudomonadota bacterium]